MLQSLEGAVDEIIENSAELKRKAIVNRSSTIFHRITNKPQEYVGLDIDPENFTVTVRGTGGTTVNTKDLSDGEKHVVALSFLGGIKESAADGTLIIDSPFGRLDQTHKSRLISNIGDLAKNVILLVTDEDLDGTELKAMKAVQKHYNLTHDQKKKFSTVVDVMAATAAGASAMPTMPSQPQTPKGPEGGA